MVRDVLVARGCTRSVSRSRRRACRPCDAVDQGSHRQRSDRSTSDASATRPTGTATLRDQRRLGPSTGAQELASVRRPGDPPVPAASATWPIGACDGCGPAAAASPAPGAASRSRRRRTSAWTRDRQRRGWCRRTSAARPPADAASAVTSSARRGPAGSAGRCSDERFMNGSRRIGVPQRGHGSSLLPVDVERPVEVAALAVDVDVERVEGGPALRRAPRPSPRDRGQQRGRPRPGQGLGRPGAVQPGPPQRLVGVDVADARTRATGRAAPASIPVCRRRSAAANAVVVEARVERVAGDVRDRRRDGPSARSTSGSTARPPKVRWSTKRSSGPPSSKREPDPQVRLVGGVRRLRRSSWPLMPRWPRSAVPAVGRGAARGTSRAVRVAGPVRPVSRGRRGRRRRQRAGDGPRVQRPRRG